MPTNRQPPGRAELCEFLQPQLGEQARGELTARLEHDLDALSTLAAEEEVESALWANLFRHNLIQPVPPALRAIFDAGAVRSTDGRPVALVLEEAHRSNSARNEHLHVQLKEIVEVLNAVDMAPALLKGARWMFHDGYKDVASRAMVDIDLLLPPDEAVRASDALVDVGYRAAHYPLRDQGRRNAHLVPLHRPDAPAPVELHVELGDWPTPEILPGLVAWSESTNSVLDGENEALRVRFLSPTHQALHTILHSEIHHRGHTAGDIPVRGLLDLAMTGATSDAEIDWARIRAAFGARSHVLDAFVHQIHVLFGQPPPDGLGGSARARRHLQWCIRRERLPALLARSLSQVAVFPGTLRAGRMSYLYDSHGFVATNAARLRHMSRMIRLTATRAGRV